MNQFLNAVSKRDTLTENQAVAHSTTGDALTDQFSKAGSQRDRDILLVFAEQSRIDNLFGKWAARLVFYLRMITRKVRFSDDSETTTVQKGQGNRDESFKRFLWYAQNKPDFFYNNLLLFCEIGSPKDVFEIMWYAKKHGISIDERRCLEIVVMQGPVIDEDNLILKYLPLQRANSKCVTERAKYRNHLAKVIVNMSKLTARDIRRTKVKGQAHTWQQLISRHMMDSIDFNRISGKALLNMVSGKFLTNAKLEDKYLSWIMSKPVAKFTGYVHELGAKVAYNMRPAIKHTIDKQFEGLIQLGKTMPLSKRKVISAIDRSGSMSATVAGTSAINIAESLGIYFSSMLEGAFKNWVIRFSQRSEWVRLTGTFSEQKLQMTWGDCPSNTNFQGIIDSFVRVREEYLSVPESDFPDTLLVVSDMQFDYAGTETNYEMAKRKLSKIFSKEYCNNFIFIWWDCTGRVLTNQPQHIDEPGGYFMSGFDGSILELLLGSVDKKVSVEQSIQDILSQEALERVDY